MSFPEYKKECSNGVHEKIITVSKEQVNDEQQMRLGDLAKLFLPFPKELDKHVERIVKPEEIDKNGHLNNARYLDWIENLIKSICEKEWSPKSVWIQYISELLEGETVTMKYTFEDEKYYVCGYAKGEETFAVVVE